MTFLQGYFYGLALIIFIGPVFFTLLQSTLEHGLKSGLAVALGIFFSDILCVLLLLGFGISSFFTNPGNEMFIGIGGAVLLIGLGCRYALKPVLSQADKIRVKTSDYLHFFIKGFLINFINPFVFAVWMGLIALADNHTAGNSDKLIFLAGILMGVLTTDSIKALFANRIKTLFQPEFLKLTYRVIGVVLILFGFRILLHVF
ncbi:MAG: LysE family transporter [Bacteroidia bacterium]|nr:LysE family transporter [Bacteroidia bacterium]